MTTTHIQTTTNNLKLFSKIMANSEAIIEQQKQENRTSYNKKKRLRIFEYCSESLIKK